MSPPRRAAKAPARRTPRRARGGLVQGRASNQDLLIHSEPGRYFMPPYVGKSGWVGAYLDGKPDWGTLAALLEEGWRLTAPKRLVARLDGASR